MRAHHVMRRLAAGLGLGVLVMLLTGLAGAPRAVAKEFTLGLQCDRSGPTQNVGPFLCDGYQDYMKLFNKKKMLGADTLRVVEIDHGYNVPKSMESYERHKSEGAVLIGIYGTPMTVALAPKLAEDKIPGTSPGFGTSASRNGTKPEYAYLFPMAASYWSQATAGIKFIMDNWKDTSRKPKIAYLFYDNPAGRDPLPVLEELQKRLGFELKTYAVPPPGLEMGPQVLEIARQYKADWVLSHLFGRAPGVSIKEFQRVGFPRNRMVSFVWGAAESDLQVAGWESGEGYYGMQFAGVGENFDVIREIKQMYKDEGKDPPKSMEVSVYYNRGVLIAAVHARAVQLAVQKKGPNITGTDVRDAMQTIKDFSLGGLLPPLNFSARDHEGGGWVQMYQAQKGKFVPVTDWYHGYPDVLDKFVYGGG
jgi:branched-chain amino acid transport system substrate-binding protein